MKRKLAAAVAITTMTLAAWAGVSSAATCRPFPGQPDPTIGRYIGWNPGCGWWA